MPDCRNDTFASVVQYYILCTSTIIMYHVLIHYTNMHISSYYIIFQLSPNYVGALRKPQGPPRSSRSKEIFPTNPSPTPTQLPGASARRNLRSFRILAKRWDCDSNETVQVGKSLNRCQWCKIQNISGKQPHRHINMQHVQQGRFEDDADAQMPIESMMKCVDDKRRSRLLYIITTTYIWNQKKDMRTIPMPLIMLGTVYLWHIILSFSASLWLLPPIFLSEHVTGPNVSNGFRHRWC